MRYGSQHGFSHRINRIFGQSTFVCSITGSNVKIIRRRFALTVELDRNFESFKVGLLLRQARERKKITQSELANLVDKKREYISRIENNSSNLTLKTLFDIVEKGLGGKVKILIEA